MERVVRVLDVKPAGAVAAVQDLLWRLMERDLVQALLVPLQTYPHESPAPTLIKNRERLDRANPLAPVMTLNSAKVVGLLLAQESDKRLGAVMRPCEARALVELAGQNRISLDNLVTISIDCLGSHEEGDYEQRAALWGDTVPTEESLRWSRRGQIAPYRFRQACQMCERPYFEEADITIGLLGQKVDKQILISAQPELAAKMGLLDDAWTRVAGAEDLQQRQRTLDRLMLQRHRTRQRLFSDIEAKAGELSGLLAMLSECTLCGECQEACPLTSTTGFDIDRYRDNKAEYLAARLLDLVRRSESCTGCGMCEAACHVALPLMLLTQYLGERAQVRDNIISALGRQTVESV